MKRQAETALRPLLIGALTSAMVWYALPAQAQSSESTPITQSTPAPPSTTMFPHPDRWWWLSGQFNAITQGHGGFNSPYEGDHSLRAAPERRTSRVWTIATGAKLGRRTEFLFNLESAGGRGLSDALGLAGFTNLDVVRNPDLGERPYVARAMVHLTFGLSTDEDARTAGPLSLATRVPQQRIELRIGKMSLADFFDVNGPGSDSHLQFMNWTIDNNGGYDYAADTRGYTYAVMAEYDAPAFAVRAAEALMPTVANGITLDWNLTRARSENVEVEVRPGNRVTIRALAFVNHANMGTYAEAIAAFLNGTDAQPDIEAHRQQGRRKYGVGLNTEATLADGIRLFARTGWNEGRNESFAYTEVNNTVQVGFDATGSRWARPADGVGGALVTNGISSEHAQYLALGGLGFLLGDGALRYGRETIVEAYYRAHVWRGLSASFDVQHIVNPGYNQDRGPVTIVSLRAHVDF